MKLKLPSVDVAKLAPSRDLLLFSVQLLAFLAVLVGVSFWSIPAALIVGGVLAIVAVEMQAKATSDDSSLDELVRARITTALKSGQNPFENGVPVTAKWLSYVDIVTRPKTLPAGIKQ